MTVGISLYLFAGLIFYILFQLILDLDDEPSCFDGFRTPRTAIFLIPLGPILCVIAVAAFIVYAIGWIIVALWRNKW